MACCVACGPTAGDADGTGQAGSETGPASTGGTEDSVSSVGPGGDDSTAADETSVGATSVGETSRGTSSGTTDDGETGDQAGTCNGDRQCKLVSCCECVAVHVDAPVDPCPVECPDTCAELGIDEAQCRYGHCRPERVSCNPNGVTCRIDPPECAADELPETDLSCWTGRCIAQEHCDWVDDCARCSADEVCVEMVGGPMPTVAQRRCEPIPVGCAEPTDCECIGSAICGDRFSCGAGDPGVVACLGA